jgi:hypothetical protein
MFRPIRVDHTDFFQMGIKTLPFPWSPEDVTRVRGVLPSPIQTGLVPCLVGEGLWVHRRTSHSKRRSLVLETIKLTSFRSSQLKSVEARGDGSESVEARGDGSLPHTRLSSGRSYPWGEGSWPKTRFFVSEILYPFLKFFDTLSFDH